MNGNLFIHRILTKLAGLSMRTDVQTLALLFKVFCYPIREIILREILSYERWNFSTASTEVNDTLKA